MNNLEARLRKLEAASTEARFCKCAGRVRVFWPDGHRAAGDNPGPERCQVCGGLRHTIRVFYGEGDKVH